MIGQNQNPRSKPAQLLGEFRFRSRSLLIHTPTILHRAPGTLLQYNLYTEVPKLFANLQSYYKTQLPAHVTYQTVHSTNISILLQMWLNSSLLCTYGSAKHHDQCLVDRIWCKYIVKYGQGSFIFGPWDKRNTQILSPKAKDMDLAMRFCGGVFVKKDTLMQYLSPSL